MTTTAVKLTSRTWGQLAALVGLATAVLLFATAPLLAEELAPVALEGTVESISIIMELTHVGRAGQLVVVKLKERQDDGFYASLSKALELGLVRQSPIEGFTAFARMSTNDELQGQRVRLTVTRTSNNRYNIMTVKRIDTGQTGRPSLKAQSESDKAGPSDSNLTAERVRAFWDKYRWQAYYVKSKEGEIASGPLRRVGVPDNPRIASVGIADAQGYGKVLVYGGVAEADSKVADDKAFVFPVDVRSLAKVDVTRIMYSDVIPAKDRIPYDKYHTVIHIADTQPVETLAVDGNIVAIAYRCIPTGIDNATLMVRRLSVLLPESPGRPLFVAINEVRTNEKNLLIGKPGTRLSFEGSENSPLRLIPGVDLWQGALDIDPQVGVILEKGTKMKLVTDSTEKRPKPELPNPPASNGEPALEQRDSSQGMDSIRLKSGEVRTGRILNESYTIKETKIETEPPGGRKARIRIPGSNIETERVGDSGIIEYRREVTLTLEYSSWQVDSIIFSDVLGTDEMLMAWGERKTGTVVMDKVTIRLPSGEDEEIQREKIKEIKLYREKKKETDSSLVPARQQAQEVVVEKTNAIEAPPQQTASRPVASPPRVLTERQAAPLGEIPWRARIQSSPDGAEVYLLEGGKPGKLLGKTPLTVAIWTETIVGKPGQMGQRSLTFHLPVLRKKDGFYCGFLIKSGDVEVKRYATWSEGLRDVQPSGHLSEIMVEFAAEPKKQ